MSYIDLNKYKTSIKDEIYIYTILNNINDFNDKFLNDELQFYKQPSQKYFDDIIYYTNLRYDLFNTYKLSNKQHINNIILIIKNFKDNVYKFNRTNTTLSLKQLMNGYKFIIKNGNIIYITNPNYISFIKPLTITILNEHNNNLCLEFKPKVEENKIKDIFEKWKHNNIIYGGIKNINTLFNDGKLKEKTFDEPKPKVEEEKSTTDSVLITKEEQEESPTKPAPISEEGKIKTEFEEIKDIIGLFNDNNNIPDHIKNIDFLESLTSEFKGNNIYTQKNLVIIHEFLKNISYLIELYKLIKSKAEYTIKNKFTDKPQQTAITNLTTIYLAYIMAYIKGYNVYTEKNVCLKPTMNFINFILDTCLNLNNCLDLDKLINNPLDIKDIFKTKYNNVYISFYNPLIENNKADNLLTTIYNNIRFTDEEIVYFRDFNKIEPAEENTFAIFNKFNEIFNKFTFINESKDESKDKSNSIQQFNNSIIKLRVIKYIGDKNYDIFKFNDKDEIEHNNLFKLEPLEELKKNNETNIDNKLIHRIKIDNLYQESLENIIIPTYTEKKYMIYYKKNNINTNKKINEDKDEKNKDDKENKTKDIEINVSYILSNFKNIINLIKESKKLLIAISEIPFCKYENQIQNYIKQKIEPPAAEQVKPLEEQTKSVEQIKPLTEPVKVLSKKEIYTNITNILNIINSFIYYVFNITYGIHLLLQQKDKFIMNKLYDNITFYEYITCLYEAYIKSKQDINNLTHRFIIKQSSFFERPLKIIQFNLKELIKTIKSINVLYITNICKISDKSLLTENKQYNKIEYDKDNKINNINTLHNKNLIKFITIIKSFFNINNTLISLQFNNVVNNILTIITNDDIITNIYTDITAIIKNIKTGTIKQNTKKQEEILLNLISDLCIKDIENIKKNIKDILNDYLIVNNLMPTKSDYKPVLLIQGNNLYYLNCVYLKDNNQPIYYYKNNSWIIYTTTEKLEYNDNDGNMKNKDITINDGRIYKFKQRYSNSYLEIFKNNNNPNNNNPLYDIMSSNVDALIYKKIHFPEDINIYDFIYNFPKEEVKKYIYVDIADNDKLKDSYYGICKQVIHKDIIHYLSLIPPFYYGYNMFSHKLLEYSTNIYNELNEINLDNYELETKYYNTTYLNKLFTELQNPYQFIEYEKQIDAFNHFKKENLYYTYYYKIVRQLLLHQPIPSNPKLEQYYKIITELYNLLSTKQFTLNDEEYKQVQKVLNVLFNNINSKELLQYHYIHDIQLTFININNINFINNALCVLLHSIHINKYLNSDKWYNKIMKYKQGISNLNINYRTTNTNSFIFTLMNIILNYNNNFNICNTGLIRIIYHYIKLIPFDNIIKIINKQSIQNEIININNFIEEFYNNYDYITNSFKNNLKCPEMIFVIIYIMFYELNDIKFINLFNTDDVYYKDKQINLIAFDKNKNNEVEYLHITPTYQGLEFSDAIISNMAMAGIIDIPNIIFIHFYQFKQTYSNLFKQNYGHIHIDLILNTHKGIFKFSSAVIYKPFENKYYTYYLTDDNSIILYNDDISTNNRNKIVDYYTLLHDFYYYGVLIMYERIF